MDTIEKKVKYIIDNFEETKGDNTKLYIKFCEYICHSRKLKPTWSNMKEIMLEYPPESITRARRNVVASTKEQMDREAEYREKYGNPAYASPDYKDVDN